METGLQAHGHSLVQQDIVDSRTYSHAADYVHCKALSMLEYALMAN